MAGRKPLPTAVKVARGNPGKRPLNTKEPAFRVRLLRAPAYFSEEAKAQWYKIGRMLVRGGILTEADGTLLEAFCVVYARWVDSEKQVLRLGTVVKSGDGDLMRNPYLMVANRALDQLIKMMGDLGLSPSSRSRLQRNEPLEQPSLVDELFRLAHERMATVEAEDLSTWGIRELAGEDDDLMDGRDG